MSRVMVKNWLTLLVAAAPLINAPAALAQVTVSLTAPTNGSSYVPPINVTLSASASAGSGYTVSKVEFFSGTTLIGTDTTSPYSINWSNVPSGQHVLTAKATAIKKNNPSQTATSAARTITVNAPPVVTLISPVAEATYSIPPPTITVNATVSDTDGTIARVEFRECGGQDVLLATLTSPPYTYAWTLQPPYWYSDPLGTTFSRYSIRVDAYDNLGAWGASSCTSVNVAPTVTLTAPVSGANFSAPANITLSATINPSDVPAVEKVEFYQGATLIGEDTTAPYSITWQNVSAGSYSLTAKVLGNGFEFQSTPVNVIVSAEPQLHFVHVDHLNTPRLVANAAGTTVWRWDQQEPFAVNVPDENPSGLGAFDLPLRLPGQYADKETNLQYNVFRDYDPSIGRYSQSDPIGLHGGINLYAYANSAPTINIDPLGLDIRIGVYPGIFASGHVGIGLVGPDGGGTVGFNPVPGAEGNVFTGVPGRIFPDNPSELIREIIITTLPWQDRCIEKCINDWTANPGMYYVTRRNCRDFVNDCLVRCNVRSSGIRPGPRPYFDDLQRQYRRCRGDGCRP